MSALEKYMTLLNTRNFLLSLSVTEDGRADSKSMSQYLLKHFPSEEEIAMLIRLQEEHYNNMWTQGDKGNPIEYRPENGGWIFWDETWTQINGPFGTLDGAQEALNEYCHHLNNEERPEQPKTPFGFYYDSNQGK